MPWYFFVMLFVVFVLKGAVEINFYFTLLGEV